MLRNYPFHSPSAQSSEKHDKKIRVCIRGIFGLLGSRIALAIGRNSDIELAVGIAKNDPTLADALKTMNVLPEDIRKKVFADKMYLDERHSIVRDLNASQAITKFEPADQLNLSKECDIVIDAASPGSIGKWMDRYCAFDGNILVQSGEYPMGRTIAPPLVRQTNDEGNIFRQGDCALSGIVPVLASLAPFASRFTMHILTQYTDKLMDYTTDQRLGSTYIRTDVKEQVQNELNLLLPETELVLLGVSQVSGLSYYTATLLVETKYPISGSDIKELLRSKPRIRVIPDLSSTYEITHYHRERLQAFGMEIPPIIVFGADLNSTAKSTLLRLCIAIDYRYIAVLPNIDAIRMLVLGMGGEDAMRMTDVNMGFDDARLYLGELTRTH